MRFKSYSIGFWTDVLDAWASFNFKKEVKDIDIYNQQLWYNSHIKQSNKMIKYDKAIHRGLFTISQFIDPDGNWIPVNTICEIYNLSILEYIAIVSAMPKEWKKYIKRREAPTRLINKLQYNYAKVCGIRKCTHYCYNTMNSFPNLLRNGYAKLQLIIPDIMDFDLYCNCFNELYITTTSNTKLRIFQYRLLHRAIILNSHLKKGKIIEDDSCSLCKNETEYMIHFFVNCYVVKQLWSSVLKLCKKFDNSVTSCLDMDA